MSYLPATILPEGVYSYEKIQGKHVCLIRPKNFVKGDNKLLWHFHGLRIAPWDSDEKGTIEYFKFLQTLNAIRPNFIMACPIGLLSPYSLADDWGSIRYLKPAHAEIEQMLGLSFSDVIISGHSAGGRVLSPIVDGGTGNYPVSTVLAFDALYSSNVFPYSSWLARSSKNRMFCVSRMDSGVYAHSKNIPGAYATLSTIDHHWNLVRDKYFADFLSRI